MNYADRVRDTATGSGTGTLTLANTPPAGYRTVSAAFTTGTAAIPLCIVQGSAWELALCTMVNATTITRDTVLSSSNGNAAVSFPAGNKDVFCVLPTAQINEFMANRATLASTATTAGDAACVVVEENGVLKRLPLANFANLILSDRTPPTVTLGSSASTVAATGSVTLTATTTDPGLLSSGIAKVEFFRNGTLFKTVTAAPYVVVESYTAADNGTIVYTAKSTDGAGNATTSTPISINVAILVDNTPPTVSLSASTTTVTAAGNLLLSAVATDPGTPSTGVSKVEFYRGTTLIATVNSAPYSTTVALTSADNGTINFTAKATDGAGNVGPSNVVPVSVAIDVAPTVYDTFAGLSAGTSIAGATWDAGGLTWHSHSVLKSDGAGALVGNRDNTVVGTFFLGSGQVGAAVFFSMASGYDAGNPPIALRIGVDATLSAGSYDSGQSGIIAHGPGYGTAYLYNEFASTNDGGTACALSADQQYCIEVCRSSNPLVYNMRISNASGGVRGSVITSSTISVASALGVNNTAVQIQIPNPNQQLNVSPFTNYTHIHRVEALTAPFSVGGGGASDTNPPQFVSAAVSNAAPTTVSLTFDEALANITPGSASFTIPGFTVTGVAVASTVVSLTVSPAVAAGNSLAVTYTPPSSGKLQDAAGNTVLAFGPVSVTNNVTSGSYLTMFDYPTTGSTIAGPTGVVVEFGAQGASAPVDVVEQVYTAMPIGFGSVTQSRWRCRPVTVDGVQFVIYPGLDSDGRVDVWVHAMTSTQNNGLQAAVDLRIKIGGVYQTLWDGTTTYSYRHQRSTWLRWQSAELPWNFSKTYIDSLIADGTFLKHDQSKAWGINWSDGDTLPAAVTDTSYKPFKAFDTDGRFLFGKFLGTQYRGSPTGGERQSIGTCHEMFARTISQVAVNNNAAWLTPAIQRAIKSDCEAIAQFPIASGMIDPATGRIIDPSAAPICTHRHIANPPIGLVQGLLVPVPQPNHPTNDLQNAGELTTWHEFDNAHAPNKLSYHAYWLTKDPYFLMLLQGHAVACMSANQATSNGRGADGKLLGVSFYDEERGCAWSFHALAQAWKSTPSGTLGKPFLPKSFFQTALDNSVTSFTNTFMGASYYINITGQFVTSGARFDAGKFWRTFSFSQLGKPGYDQHYMYTPYMADYVQVVFCHILLMGYSNIRSLAEWKTVNLQRRLQMTGTWYEPEPDATQNAGMATMLVGVNDTVLPYSSNATYKTWYPRPTGYKDGVLAPTDWVIPGLGTNETIIFRGAVNITKECVNRGLMTLPFDVAAEEARFDNEHPNPTSGQQVWLKSCFGY